MAEVGDDVLDREPGGVLDALDQISPQPAGVDGRIGRQDDLLRPVYGDGIHRGQKRVGVADFATGLDALRSDR
jgi:hypothetical protein